MKYKVIKDYISSGDIIRKRKTVRAYCIFKGKIMVLHLKYNNDKFGPLDYYETPGGGVEDGETIHSALERELQEEIGSEGKILSYLGIVGIEYKAYHAIAVCHMYVFKVTNIFKNNLTDKEKVYNLSVEMLDLDEYLDILLSRKNEDSVVGMIYSRDEYLLKKNYEVVKEFIKKE